MNPLFKKVHSEIARGMRLSRCRKCGCMKGTLENLKASLPLLKTRDSRELLAHVNEWYGQLEPLEYPCFGCKYCIPPEAMTMLTKKYPVLASATLSTCEITVHDGSWPPVEGEYTVMDASAAVAVSTLASEKLEEKLVKLKPAGMCIVGKTETENIGIDKIIKNVISNPAIKSLIVTGKDTEGHQSGRTLLALWHNGVDKQMRIIGSGGRRPILKNVSRAEVERFRKQVEMEDLIGTENSRTIAKRIKEISSSVSAAAQTAGCGCGDDACAPVSVPVMPAASSGCGCGDVCGDEKTAAGPGVDAVPDIPTVKAKKQNKKTVKLDRAGYFVILPSRKRSVILVEHYSYDNRLLRKIEGTSGRDIYFTIINNGWISEMSHAAYLGKELTRAEMSMKNGTKYVQDGA